MEPFSSLELPDSLSARLRSALDRVAKDLLAARTAEGHWLGELSSSALSTATAVTALAVVQRESNQITSFETRISKGLAWLAAHTNRDGGWGDTTQSRSNISTTTLCWAAFGAVHGADESYASVLKRAEDWLTDHVTRNPKSETRNPKSETRNLKLETRSLVAALMERYGKDRTFSIPILTMCALSGRLGPGDQAWKWVMPLPFELAALPHQCFAALRLPVVSYALPALIAIGQARHFHLASRNPLIRLLRNRVRRRTLRILQEIQPASGGFLEATPLTSFVVMSLAGSGEAEHAVTKRGVEFLAKSQRTDGSWAIDSNLATWVTTLSVNALAGSADIRVKADSGQAARIAGWLLGQRFRVEHPYTHAAPGGWAWTDLPGGVPDADDTAGAIRALVQLQVADPALRDAALAKAVVEGAGWLIDLQNRDGGIPTFCRGWGALPFDRSSPDITAHAMRAWIEALPFMAPAPQKRVACALRRALRFLESARRPDGAWAALWFGNEFAPGEENLVYGTSRVVCALAQMVDRPELCSSALPLCRQGADWLIACGNTDGGWGGGPKAPSSVEETALAVEALAAGHRAGAREASAAITQGTAWLLARVESGEWKNPAPIGLYFARLWYYEKLYPQIFTAGTLARVAADVRRRSPE
jgi:squalene-hopene/tetraprenyl-beta-curcumene cyclase